MVRTGYWDRGGGSRLRTDQFPTDEVPEEIKFVRAQQGMDRHVPGDADADPDDQHDSLRRPDFRLRPDPEYGDPQAGHDDRHRRQDHPRAAAEDSLHAEGTEQAR